MKPIKTLVFLFLILFSIQGLASEEFKIVSWNVESGGSSIDKIAERIGDFQGVDIWGLSEVPQSNAKDEYIDAAAEGENASYDGIMSTLRGNDRLMIVYNSDRLELLESTELVEIALITMRPALVGKFKIKNTNISFYFVVNHMARNPDYQRCAQSRALRIWANRKNTPLIMVGDFNYDWDVQDGENNHDKGYDYLTYQDKLSWIKPPILVTTQCSASDDGIDCIYNSVLDFIFVNEEADAWTWSSEIIVETGDFPDDDETSDHRPVQGIFEIDVS